VLLYLWELGQEFCLSSLLVPPYQNKTPEVPTWCSGVLFMRFSVKEFQVETVLLYETLP